MRFLLQPEKRVRVSNSNINQNKLNNIWFAGIYYVPVVLAYVLNMFFEFVRPGVFATLCMILVAVELVLRKQINLKMFTDRLVAAYFIYNSLSVIWLVRGGLPARVYLQEYVVSLLPVIFYYVGRTCNNETDGEGKELGFYRFFIYACLIIGALGIVLQIVMPQFYIDYSYKMLFVSKADASTCRVRMDSVVGCTVLGSISVTAMLAAIPFIMEKKLRVFGIIAMVINLVVAFMSNQRSAMVVALIVIVYFNYLIFFQYKIFEKKYFYYELAALAALFVMLCLVRMDAVLKIYYRLVSLPGAVSERSEQWIAAVNNMYSTWLGNGLGANGHKALFIEGTHVIADGGLVKMYCEEGVFGFSMFIYILILTARRGMTNVKKYCVELGIIAIALLQSIGSNILAFQLTTPVFWFAIGRIFADAMVNNDIKSEIKEK